MTVVWSADDLAEAYARTRVVAQAIFGDDRVYVERYLEHARHIEVQVLGDGHGGAVHLGTRDCSVQRRHQKLVEEGPAQLAPATFDAITKAAVDGAKSVDYSGAGTFEFLMDTDERFSFMEVNCRIQVEHPVTEMISGVDLVHEQLHIAAGGGLRLPRPTCASTAMRWSAGSTPRTRPGLRAHIRAPGPVRAARRPVHPRRHPRPPGLHGRPALRLAAGEGRRVGAGRDLALDRMDRALAEFVVEGNGVRTTIPFLRRVLDDEAFRKGRYTTGLVDRLLHDGTTTSKENR